MPRALLGSTGFIGSRVLLLQDYSSGDDLTHRYQIYPGTEQSGYPVYSNHDVVHKPEPHSHPAVSSSLVGLLTGNTNQDAR